MNRFGTATLKFGLCDLAEVANNRTRFQRDMVNDLARVNHFYCPAGRWPFKGWILLPRYEYNQIDKYSTDLELEIGDPNKQDNVGTLKNLCISHAQCVTRGLESDDNALYLIEITDARAILHNKWFQFPLTQSYNIRAPAYPDTFHPGSMSGGTTWTWDTMVRDIWDRFVPIINACPGLPYAPAGTPEGFWFQGVPAWTALCDILDHLGMNIACDLTQANPFSIVSSGATDTTFTSLQSSYIKYLEDDLEWIDAGAARVPATVDVLFKRRNSIYGTEETVRYDTLQWNMTPLYSVTVNAPSTFSSAVGEHHIWSDFTVRYDHDNNPVAADVTTATAIANERVTQYFARIYDQTLGRMDQTYARALSFKTGARVDGVKWWMDSSNYRGWRTQIVRGCEPPWLDIWK